MSDGDEGMETGRDSISPELFTGPELSHGKPWLIASVAAAAILAISGGAMWKLGLFATPTDATGDKTLAAALALIGSVLAAVVTLIGTVVKYSIDDRNARLATIEAGRNYALALEAEQRNRTEVAIRAVDLLSENNKDTTPHQAGGALLALVSLGELDLAVALLAELWPAGMASFDVAGSVLRAALKRGSEGTQISAATVLRQNAAMIEQEGAHIWPIGVADWRTDLPNNCRLGLILSAAEWMKCALGRQKSMAPAAAFVLYQALDDPDESVSDIAASTLRPYVQAYPQGWGILTDRMPLRIEDIAERLTEFGGKPNTAYGEMSGSAIEKVLTKAAEPPAPAPST